MVVATRELTALSQRSSYTKYLPAIYADSDFMGRFLMIFESVRNLPDTAGARRRVHRGDQNVSGGPRDGRAGRGDADVDGA